MQTTIKTWLGQLRTVARGMADGTADYQPPTMHVGTDGAWMTTIALHDRADDGWSDTPAMQITIRGGDGQHNIERHLLAALDAVRAGRIVR